MKHFEFTLSDIGLLTFPTARASKSTQIEVVTARLDVEPEALRTAAALLSPAEQHKANRFVFDCDRRRFIVARSRLRRLLGARLSVRPEGVELVYGKHGKPALARRFSGANVHFNVAHTEDVAVFAFSSELDIGVDVETVRVMRDAGEIAARFFSRTEYAAYCALAPDDKPLGFLTCWTRKEAFVKALGDGLYQPLNSFDTSGSRPLFEAQARNLRTGNATSNTRDWALHSFSPGPGLIAAVAVKKRAEALVERSSPRQGAIRAAFLS